MADPDLPVPEGRLPVMGIEDPEFAAVLPGVEAHAAEHGADDDEEDD